MKDFPFKLLLYRLSLGREKGNKKPYPHTPLSTHNIPLAQRNIFLCTRNRLIHKILIKPKGRCHC